MTTYIARRFLQIPPVILIVTMIMFLVVRIVGCPVELMVGEDARTEDIERLRQEMGLDRPLHIQYVDFLGDIVRGDFGRSYQFGEDAFSLVVARLPATAQLGVSAILIAVLISVPAGIISALKQYSAADYSVTTFALLGQAMPNFWLGIMLIILFAVTLGWLPVSGRHHGLISLVLPAVTLGTRRAAILTRLMRSNMLEVIRLDYITTAKAKGLAPAVVTFRHALRNALIPYITILGLQTAVIMGGAMVTEQVFAWPGMGRLAVTAVQARDLNIVVAFLFIITMIVLLANLLVDILYTVIDPRIKYS